MESVHEEWRTVKGHEGYEVSSSGRVRSVNRLASDGRKLKGRILRPGLINRGYLYVVMCKGGVKHNALVHRLVAEAFLGTADKATVNHIDGDKLNNSVSNLEYATYLENSRHAIRTGLMANILGERHYASKYTEKEVRLVHRIVMSGVSRSEAAAITGVSKNTVKLICSGRRWKHLGLQAIPKGDK